MSGSPIPRIRCRTSRFPRAFPRLALLAVALVLGAVPAVLAQEDPQHASCRALARVDQQAGCAVYTLSLPILGPDRPLRTAEEIAAEIPGTTRLTKSTGPRASRVSASWPATGSW